MNYENADNILVVTIGIQMHGIVINGELDATTKIKYKNVRMLSKSGGLKAFETCTAYEYFLLSNLNELFRKNLELSTFDIISNAKSGVFLGDIPFDKLLTTSNENLQGVYLISIHKGRKLIYPNETNITETINLLDTSDLYKLASQFGSVVPRLNDLSTPLPSSKIYEAEEDRIEQNSSMSYEEKENKIKEIRKQFHSAINKWSLTMNNSETQIQSIKLSVLVELVKILINEPCVINLLDYSCTSYPDYKYTDTENWSMPTTHADIETGVPYPNLGGRKRKVSRKKYSKKRVGIYNKIKYVRKNKTNRKCKKNSKNKKNRK
jgi:hypothetical protein